MKLIINKLDDGGYTVSLPYSDPGRGHGPHFACSGVREALDYIGEKMWLAPKVQAGVAYTFDTAACDITAQSTASLKPAHGGFPTFGLKPKPGQPRHPGMTSRAAGLVSNLRARITDMHSALVNAELDIVELGDGL